MPASNSDAGRSGMGAEDEDPWELGTAVAAIRAAAVSAQADAVDLLRALELLHWVQSELTGIEPALIGAARQAGVSWQALAPVLGVASRQAAERRYLRLVPAAADPGAGTRDGRVRAERDRRAGHRAVTRWANDNTADLRSLAGQITALNDLGDEAAAPIGRLHKALADFDASTLPALLAEAHPHLRGHPDLAGQVDAVTTHATQVRHNTQQRRDATSG
jgi:hypothetical protein